MNLGLILSLLETTVSLLEKEARLRFEKKLYKLKKAYNEELSKPDHLRSDLTLNTILFDATILAQLVIESRKS